MNLDSLPDEFKNMVQSIFHVGWLSTLLTALITILITAFVAKLVSKLLRRLLHMSQNPLPSSSIFINIARVSVWCVGICVVLSTCFNVNISAAITALGVGGIAVSLGFQSTLSNLIGGLQISVSKLVEPGDHIQVGTNTGIVHDVSWRHTVIVTAKGDKILIPNSVINTSALIKMPPQNDVRLDILVDRVDGKTPEDLAKIIEEKVDAAVSSITLLKAPSEISYFGANDTGYKGTLYFSVGTGIHMGAVKDVAIKALSGYGKRISIQDGKPTMAKRISEHNEELIEDHRKRKERKREKERAEEEKAKKDKEQKKDAQKMETAYNPQSQEDDHDSNEKKATR